MTSRRDLLPRMIELSELRDRTDAEYQEERLLRCDQRHVLEETQDRLRVTLSLRMEIWALIRRRLPGGRPRIYQKFTEWCCRLCKRQILPMTTPSASGAAHPLTTPRPATIPGFHAGPISARSLTAV
jgi:hypothetical protein